MEVVLEKKGILFRTIQKWTKISFLFYQVREKVPHVSPEVGEVFSVADPGKAIRLPNGTKYVQPTIDFILALLSTRGSISPSPRRTPPP